jgi:8-oxo-dGTP diphosphatase
VPALAFDHDRILRVAYRRLREDLHFRPVGFELLPEKFTMPQLQRLYEAILDFHFDRRNFMKKMLATGILEDTGTKESNTAHRAATYYRFNQSAYHQFKTRRNFNLEF